MAGNQLRSSPNPTWLSIVRHSYKEFFQLIFCGMISVGVLALLAHWRLHPFVELHAEVVKHLISLPVGLVLLAMFATTIPLLLVNFLASVLRALAAQHLAILAFHMSCLWYGAQITTQLIGVDYRNGELLTSLGGVFDVLRANFTVVAMALASAVIARGAFDEHSSISARLMQTSVAIGAMYFFYELLTTQNATTKNGLALVSNSTTTGWALISAFFFVLIGLASLQNVSETGEFDFEAKGKEDAIRTHFSNGESLAQLLYPESKKSEKLNVVGAGDGATSYEIEVNNKVVGVLKLTQAQKRKVAWQLAVKNGAVYEITISTQQGSAKGRTKIAVNTHSMLDKRIWKRFVQSLSTPPGLLSLSVTMQTSLA